MPHVGAFRNSVTGKSGIWLTKKQIVHLHLARNGLPYEGDVQLLGEHFHILSIPTGGDVDLAVRLIEQVNETSAADVIALDGLPLVLEAGQERMRPVSADRLAAASPNVPLVDGSGVRGAFERWAVQLIQQSEPGLFAHKRVLFTPSLNHIGLVEAISQLKAECRWADPILYYGHSRPTTSEAAARHRADRLLKNISNKGYERIFPPAGQPRRQRSRAAFEWADILAGDIPAIRRYAPQDLRRKVVIGECASDEAVSDLRKRGAGVLITTMPPITDSGMDERNPARWPAAVVEACLAAIIGAGDRHENDYLNLMAELDWRPSLIYLQEEARINRFAFVIHPLTIRFIYAHKALRYLRWVPDRWIEWGASYISPLRVSRMTGIRSEATGQIVEGDLYTLGSTPRIMMKRPPSFTYRKLEKAAVEAEKRGARIIGLGAFTSVVGDAGATVARNSSIAVTSGNSLTVAATLETAKQAAISLGVEDLTQGRAMVIGATGSIGAVCSRLLAQALGGVTLVAPRPERLIALKRQIEGETPGAIVQIATSPNEYIADMDVIVTTTTALGQRIVDITRCKPGAVICDVARPPDIEAWEAALRPDVLVIESGEILLPGDPDIGYDVGLPPKTAYACMAETALLAMEGRFEDFSIGRELELEKVKEIYRLFRKHGLQLAGMRSFDQYVTDEDIIQRKRLADELRNDPSKLQELQQKARVALEAGDRQIAKEFDQSEMKQKNQKRLRIVAIAVAVFSVVARRVKGL